MKGYVKWMDGNSKLLKVILAIPVLDVLWVIYRIFKSGAKKNTLGVVLGIILIVVGLPILWLIDIITLVLSDKVVWVD